MSVAAVLSLGGNVGDRKALMDAAVARIAALPRTTLRARSSYYRTAPDGPVAQPWFVNMAVAVTTDLARDALAAACRGIEADLGRNRKAEIPWGPRPVDIDVIVYGSAAEIDRRAFVVVPVAEIAPALRLGATTAAALAAAADASGVEKLDWSVPVLA